MGIGFDECLIGAGLVPAGSDAQRMMGALRAELKRQGLLKPLVLHLGGVQSLHNADKVVVLEVRGETDAAAAGMQQLQKLAAVVKGCFLREARQTSREFLPHVTIAKTTKQGAPPGATIPPEAYQGLADIDAGVCVCVCARLCGYACVCVCACAVSCWIHVCAHVCVWVCARMLTCVRA